MPLFRRNSLCWTAGVLALAFGWTNAQTCYYPDGKTISSAEIPCNASAPVSPCCRSDQFCLVGGLCFGGGIVTRGSCTAERWNAEVCAAVCTTVDTSSTVGITPCTNDNGPGASNAFVCGVNTTECATGATMFEITDDLSILLRPAQLASLLEPALASVPSMSSMFTTGQFAGALVGICIPFLILVAILVHLLRKEKQKTQPTVLLAEKEVVASSQGMSSSFVHTPKREDFPIPVSPMPVAISPSVASSGLRSRRSSILSSQPSPFPLQSPSNVFGRYVQMRQSVQSQDYERHELDSTPTTVTRIELGEKRMSN